MKAKVSMQKPVYNKDMYLLKEEVVQQLDALFMKLSLYDETNAVEVLDILKKVEYIFD
ncbi:hypothetical protein [Solibacillus sp. FSL H8-0538]|uniref:hypothetical protein n=1 Tax=Solibacillus sp. FSL H8-0538 TaxID=2921400 RepID=UPI0030F79058